MKNQIRNLEKKNERKIRNRKSQKRVTSIKGDMIRAQKKKNVVMKKKRFLAIRASIDMINIIQVRIEIIIKKRQKEAIVMTINMKDMKSIPLVMKE